MNKNILEAVVPALVLGVITLLFQLFMSYLFDNNSIVSIGNSTFLNEEEYILSIDIQTYNQVLEDLEIVINSKLNRNQIITSRPVDLEIMQDDISAPNSTTLQLKEISKEQVINLFILSDKKISNDNIKVYSNSKLTILHDSLIENPFEKQLKSALFTAVIYSILIFCSTYYTNSKHEQRNSIIKEHFDKNQKLVEDELKRSDQRNENWKEEFKVTELKIAELKIDIKEIEERSLKKQILLQSKLSDYRKELNFWKDTIRKILYKQYGDNSKTEKIFEVVTKSLQTYQTNEKNDYDLDTLTILSKIIKDFDKERKQ